MPADRSPCLVDAVSLAILRANRGADVELEPEDSRLGQLQRHAGAAALRAAGFPAAAGLQPVGEWVVLPTCVAAGRPGGAHA